MQYTVYVDASCTPIPDPQALVRDHGDLRAPDYLTADRFLCGPAVYYEAPPTAESLELATPVALLEEQPRFWREVRQLYFAFQNDDWDAICTFYRKRGRLGYALVHPHYEIYGIEPASWALVALDWFRTLTLLTEWLKEKKIERLWEKIHEMPGSGSKPGYLTDSDDIDWGIAYHPRLGLTIREDGTWTLPFVHHPVSNDEGLVRKMWGIISREAEKGLNCPAVTITPDFHHYEATGPLVGWRLLGNGALWAAFCQWYLQELAHIKAKVCESSDCDGLVIPPKQNYCSGKCARREKKRRYRERKKVRLKRGDSP